MKVHRISSDALVMFGKYKGKSVIDVLTEDPAYFIWCIHAGIATVDTEVSEYIDQWSSKNGTEARKARLSGDQARKNREAGETIIPPRKPSDAIPAPETLSEYVKASAIKAAPVQVAPVPVSENWGTW